MNRTGRMAAFVAATALGAGLAHAADNDSDDIGMTASQGKSCIINLPAGVADSAIVLDLDDPDDDALVNVVNASFTYGDSYCNTAHFITLAATRMTRDAGAGLAVQGAGSDAFNDTVDFTVALDNWNGGTINVDTSTIVGPGGSATLSAAVFDAFRNDAVTTNTNTDPGVTVSLTTIAQTDPLLHGNYTGSITFTLQAQP